MNFQWMNSLCQGVTLLAAVVASGAVLSAEPTGKLVFSNVTVAALDQAVEVSRHFWAGMPDVNGDGCLDLFAGNHIDTLPSAMYLQNRDPTGCLASFTYIPTSTSNYTQAAPATPRITSRFMWGNWYDHPQGLWSFFGHDVDGGLAARYVVSSSSTVGAIPQYEPKSVGCFGSKMFCLPLDLDGPLDSKGDGHLEMMTRSRNETSSQMGYIRNISNGNLLYTPDPAGQIYSDGLLVFDVNGDSYPDVVHPDAHGYWAFNPQKKSLDWHENKFPASLRGSNPNHTIPFDYDNDGDLDLYVGVGVYNEGKGPDQDFTPFMFRNEGDGSFTDVTEAAGLATPGLLKNTSYFSTYGNTVAADLDQDGYQELIYGGESTRHTVTGGVAISTRVVILRNNGNGSFSVDRSNDFGPFESPTNNDGKPWVNAADYNNDGLIDIVKTHGDSGPNHESIALFKNHTSTSNHWLRVRVRGVGNNTDGLHTKLTFRAKDTNEILAFYEVGALSIPYQNLLPHAGVGQHQRINLEVQFPHAGPRYVFADVAADQDVIVFPDGKIIEGYIPGNAIPLTSEGGRSWNAESINGVATLTGSHQNLAFGSAAEISNEGLITNASNEGLLKGGTLAGLIHNSGRLVDVSLAAALVKGGKIEGSLRGDGVVNNALLDVEHLDAAITLGTGTTLTEASVKALANVDLTTILAVQGGVLDLTKPLLVKTVGNVVTELSAADLMLEVVNAFFNNTSSTFNSGVGKPVLLSNSALPGQELVLRPTAARTTTQQDGLKFTATGQLEITNSGVLLSFTASSVDRAALVTGLQQSAAQLVAEADGLMWVKYRGETFSFTFDLLSELPATKPLVPTALTTSNPAAFTFVGGLQEPQHYRIMAHYANGIRQALLPAIHDAPAFADALAGAGQRFQISATEGVVQARDSNSNQLLKKWMPSYIVSPLTEAPVLAAGITEVNDLNGDGQPDCYFVSKQGKQVLYGLNF